MARGSTAAEIEERASRPGGAPAKLHFSVSGFRNRLHAWYRENARVLPWRGVQDPYATWLSEIMLQQTRVATVRDRYHDFLERFPTLQDLAEAAEEEVLALWSGLGYYRRARLLHRGAQFVTREMNGKLPRTAVQLRTLPGVGDYTAAAIASIAFGESIAVIDGNVERVLLRVLGMPEERSAAARAELAAVAQSLVPAAARRAARSPASRSSPSRPALSRSPAGRSGISPGDHNQAMMELGAMVCLPKGPLCLQCPLLDICKTRGEHLTARREVRQSRNVAYLLALRKRGIITESLLQRRPETAAQMPGMLELPPLLVESLTGREPVLRLRHSITNTNFYVEIYAESAPGIAPVEPVEHDPDAMFDSDEMDSDGPEQLGAPSFEAGAADAGVADVAAADVAGADVARSAAGERWPGDLADPSAAAGARGRRREGKPGRQDDAVATAETIRAAGASPAAGSSRLAAGVSEPSLVSTLSAAESDLLWVSASDLVYQPLTGLARKALQRLGIMPMPKVRLD